MEAFATLAEVAVGVAGFGSIAIVLAREEGWSGSDLFRVSAFLMSSLGALLLALMPIGLGGSVLDETAVMRVSSGLILLYATVFMLVNFRLRSRHLERELYFGPTMLFVVASTGLLSLAAQLVNALASWPGSAVAPFFGIVWLLAFACLMLVRILFYRPIKEIP